MAINRATRNRAQGAFEYILLLAGILLIVVVVIMLLRGSIAGQANQTLQAAVQQVGTELSPFNQLSTLYVNSTFLVWTSGAGAIQPSTLQGYVLGSHLDLNAAVCSVMVGNGSCTISFSQDNRSLMVYYPAGYGATATLHFTALDEANASVTVHKTAANSQYMVPCQGTNESCGSPGACQNCSSSTGYYGSPFCVGNNVTQEYRAYYCSATSCAYSSSNVTSQECSYNCSSGVCVLPPPPQYSQAGQNSSMPDYVESVSLSAYWNDSNGLSAAWLATNETGVWRNVSTLSLSGNASWSRFYWSNSSADPGTVVGWRIYVNNSFGALNSTPVNSFRVSAWWPKFQRDLGNAGYTRSKAPNDNSTLWSFDAGVQLHYSCPVVADGKVFFTGMSYNNVVYAVDAFTGQSAWNFTGGGSMGNCPAYANGRVFVGSNDNKLYALNSSAGQSIWNFTAAYSTGGTSPAVSNGRVFFVAVGSGTMRVYAVNETTGAQSWSNDYGYWGMYTAPAVVDGRVFVSSFQGGSSNYGGLFVMNESTGTEIWTYTSNDFRGGCAAMKDGRVLIPIGTNEANVGHFYAFDAANGSQLWSYQTSGELWSSAALAYGKVFFGTSNYGNVLYALYENNGSLAWSYEMDYQWGGALASGDGKIVVHSSSLSKLFAFNASVNSTLWTYDFGSDGWLARSDQCAIANGIVYCPVNTTIKALGSLS
jgi:outer membrane protein assembly factor BamB